MRLYHGTTGAVALRALTEGLVPRDLRGAASTFKENPSHGAYVYLTSAYALYFANCATMNRDEDEYDPATPLGIVEVDAERLDQSRMAPDEDWLEQGSRRPLPGEQLPDWWFYIGLDECDTMEERTAAFREHLHVFASSWRASVDGIGNAAHRGTIPASAITRVAILNPAEMREGPSANLRLWALDPSVSIPNYMVMGAKYRALTRLVFDPGEVTVEDLHPPLSPLRDEQRAMLEEVRRSRAGIRVLQGGGLGLRTSGPGMMPSEEADRG